MRATMRKVKRVAAGLVVAGLVAAYVPGVADVLTAAIVASWALIAAVTAWPALGLLRPYMPMLRGYGLRVAAVAGPWLSPRTLLAVAGSRTTRVQIGGRAVRGLPAMTLPSTRWR